MRPEFDSHLWRENREQNLGPESVGLERRLSRPQDGGGGTLRHKGADSLGISGRHRTGRIILGSFVCVAALGGLFTKRHFIVVIAASEDVPRMARQDLSGTCDRGGTLEDAYPCVLCRTATSAVRS